MSSNSLGKIFTFTTWGESHGKAIGCVVDGVPSRIKLSEFGYLKLIFSKAMFFLKLIFLSISHEFNLILSLCSSHRVCTEA